MQISDQERAVLRGGFQGPRPGSNAFPLLELRRSGIKIPGARIYAMVRAGLLVATPRENAMHIIEGGNAGPYGEIPDIELSFNYRLKE